MQAPQVAAVLCLPSMQHTIRYHAVLNHGCPLQTTDSDEYGGTAPFSEAEARIIKLIAEGSPLRSFVNLHSGEFALYAPWDSQQMLAVGQPVGPGFILAAATAASNNSLWARLWVRDPFWALLLPEEAHCGLSCWPLLLQCATAATLAKPLAHQPHAGVCTCCLPLLKPVYWCKHPARGLCAGW